MAKISQIFLFVADNSLTSVPRKPPIVRRKTRAAFASINSMATAAVARETFSTCLPTRKIDQEDVSKANSGQVGMQLFLLECKRIQDECKTGERCDEIKVTSSNWLLLKVQTIVRRRQRRFAPTRSTLTSANAHKDFWRVVASSEAPCKLLPLFVGRVARRRSETRTSLRQTCQRVQKSKTSFC